MVNLQSSRLFCGLSSSGGHQKVMARNGVHRKERGLWAAGHKGTTGPRGPVIVTDFFLTACSALSTHALIRVSLYFECGTVPILRVGKANIRKFLAKQTWKLLKVMHSNQGN